MREGGCGRWIRKVICRNVNCLHRRYGSRICGSNSLLQHSHFFLKRWLVADRRGNAPKKRRDFRTSLSKTEDVINKDKQIPMLFISKVFCHSKPGEPNAK